MIRRPPRSTRTDTLFPYTTLFRSADRISGVAVRRGSAIHRRTTGCLCSAGLWLDLSWTHADAAQSRRSEEHTSELQSLMRISYAVFCLKKKKKTNRHE